MRMSEKKLQVQQTTTTTTTTTTTWIFPWPLVVVLTEVKTMTSLFQVVKENLPPEQHRNLWRWELCEWAQTSLGCEWPLHAWGQLHPFTFDSRGWWNSKSDFQCVLLARTYCYSNKGKDWITNLYYVIDRILCSPFSCPASGRLTPGETVSAQPGYRWCAHIYKVEEAAVEKPPTRLAGGRPIYPL